MRRNSPFALGLGEHVSRGALAALLVAQPLAVAPVLAQAFQGAPSVTLGDVAIDRGVTGLDTLVINTPQATVNWTPTDTGIGGGPINFLPAGFTANYVAGSVSPGTPVTILNRIIAADPSRSIGFNGAVNSDPGVAVWFYAPGGILLSDSARFNVGSLLLTANDPVTDGAGNFLFNGNRFGLAAAANSGAEIKIDPGARIQALADNSYVIAVAPRIYLQGGIEVNGSAALVTAEAVDFTLNAGLFDITATVGSASPAGLRVEGSVTGPAGNGGQGVYHRVYLMAMPKNDFVSLVVASGATLGFDVAAAADLDGNAIILSAGHDITASPFGDPIARQPANATTADVIIGAANHTSTVHARANGRASVSLIGGTAGFAANLGLKARDVAEISTSGGRVDIVGTALVAADARPDDSNIGSSRTAGRATILAVDGGVVTIGGDAIAGASARGDDSLNGAGPGGTGAGGRAEISAARNGILTIGGDVFVQAGGTGGGSDSAVAGDGLGGSGTVEADTGGRVTITGSVFGGSEGIGGSGSGGNLSGNGRGGTIALNSQNGGILTIDGGAALSADGIAGGSIIIDGQNGGNGTGGLAQATAGAGGSIGIGGDLRLSASGTGGDDVAGIGSGGTASIAVFGAASDIQVGGADVALRALGDGGFDFGGGPGGAALGGRAEIVVDGGRFATTAPDGNLVVDAGAIGGDGVSGGRASGGQAEIRVINGGDLETDLATALLATTTGGAGADGNGGDAIGVSAPDTAAVSVRTNAAGGALLRFGRSLLLDGSAEGGQGARFGGTIGDGGDAAGGRANIRIEAADFSVSGLLTSVSGARGGDGINGGDAVASGNLLTIRSAVVSIADTANADSNAIGGNAAAGSGGNGGNATSAPIVWNVQGDAITRGVLTAGGFFLGAQARGGNGGSGDFDQRGGNGGTATAIGIADSGFQVLGLSAGGINAELVTDFVDARADAIGGAGGAGGGSDFGTAPDGGSGGNAIGGFSNIGTISGPVGAPVITTKADLGIVNFDFSATGGNGGAGGDGPTSGSGGRGGDAGGGTGLLLIRGSELTASAVSIRARAFAGAGGSGGNTFIDAGGGTATGGSGGILATPHAISGNAATVTIANLEVDASAQGGSSLSQAGNAIGGEASVKLEQRLPPAPNVAVTGTLTIAGDALLSARGTGGAAGQGGFGGDGTGGFAGLKSVAGDMRINGLVDVRADGLGGIGGLNSATPGDGTGGSAQFLFDGGAVLLSGPAAIFSAQGLGGNATGGAVGIESGAAGGLTTISGLAALNANATTDTDFGPLVVGGNISVNITPGAELRFAGAVAVTARADADILAAQAGAQAFGGGVNIVSGGTIGFDAGLTVDVGARSEVTAGPDASTAFGGNAVVTAEGGSLSFTDISIIASATGGGSSSASATSGGGATGGLAELAARNGGTLLGTGNLRLDAVAIGNDAVAGSAATGGRARLLSVDPGSRIDLTAVSQQHILVADAISGDGTTVSAGAALGGSVRVETGTGAATAITAGLRMSADAIGGDAQFAVAGPLGAADSARGGTVDLVSDGAFGIDGDMLITADAFGGRIADLSLLGLGGTGTGGFVTVTAGAGSLDFNANLGFSANGTGGFSLLANAGTGTGGSGVGGITLLSTLGTGASIDVAGNLDLAANGLGGRVTDQSGLGGDIGGSAIGGTVQVASAGRISLAGNASLSATALGDSASSGGSAQGGSVGFGSTGGDLSITGTTDLLASARGGDAAPVVNGPPGTGGSANGGFVDLFIDSPSGSGSVIATFVMQDGSGTGGRGAAGPPGNTGSAGGNASGGTLRAASFGGTGTLSIGALAQNASGRGGDGGSAGSIDSGGIGGEGQGGSIVTGSTIADPDNPQPTGPGGNFVFASLDMNAQGQGGTGGDGGIAGGGGGGRGGDARLVANGGSVSITGDSSLLASGFGGARGAGTPGAPDGSGSGGTAIAAVAPAQVPGVSSSLSGANLTGRASGSAGGPTGNTVHGNLGVTANGGSLAFAGIDMLAAGTSPPPNPQASQLSAVNGSIAVANTLSIATPGDIALGADNTAITAGTALNVISGAAIIPGPNGQPPATPGTISAATITLAAQAGINAPSNFSAGTLLASTTAGAIALGNVQSVSALAIAAPGALTLGNVTGTANVELAAVGALSTGAIRAEQQVIIDTAAGLATGNISAGDSVFLRTAAPAADITTGAIDAGILRPSLLPGATGAVYLDAPGAVATGTVTARGSFGAIARGGSVTTGAIIAGPSAVVLAATGAVLGGVTTAANGDTYVASAVQAALVVENGGIVDYTALLATNPVRLGGDIALTGAVDTGRLRAAATGTITAGAAILGSLGVRLDAGLIDIGDVASGGFFTLITDTDLLLGNVRAETDVELTATGDIVAGNVSAGDSVSLVARQIGGVGGSITTGAIDAGILRPSSDPTASYGVFIDAEGLATLGAITAAGAVGLMSRGAALATGNIDAGQSVALLASTGITTGGITTAPGQTVFAASDMMASLITTDGNGDPVYGALLASQPVRLAGNLAIAGPVDTGLFTAAATGTISVTGLITTGNGLRLDAGSLALGNVISNGGLTLITDTNLGLGDVTAASEIDVTATGDITAGSITAGTSVSLVALQGNGAGGNITTGAIDAGRDGGSGRVHVEANGAASTGAITARAEAVVIARGAALSVGNVDAGSIALLGGSSVASGALATAPDGVGLVGADTMASLITVDPNGRNYTALFTAPATRVAGPVTVTGGITGGFLRAAASGPLAINGAVSTSRSVTIAGGSVTLADVTAGGVLAGGNTATLVLSADAALAAGNLRAETDISLTGGAIITGNISAGDSVSIGPGNAPNPSGSISTGAIDAGILRASADPQAAYQVGITAPANLATGAITARGNVGLLARGGNAALGNVATDGSVLILARSGAATGSIATGTAGTLYVANASMEAALPPGLDPLGPSSAFQFASVFALAPVRIAGPVGFGGAISAGRVAAATTGGFAAQAISARQSLAIDSGGRAAFAGAVSAPTIVVTAADLELAAAFGTATTNDIALNIDPSATAITIGGSGANPGWSLSNAEAGRLKARNIAIAATATISPRINVETLTLAGTGTQTSFGIITPGSIRVNGAVTMSGAAATETLRLSAGQRLEIATDTGGRIELSNTPGTLSGILALSAGSIWVATEALLGQLAVDPDFAGRDVALARAAATPDLAGAVFAGTITASARNALLIQNSGSPFQRAGFSAGSGGLSVIAAGTAPLDVVINGRALNANGEFSVNQNTIEQVAFPSAGGIGYTATSSVNGCTVGGVCALAPEQGGNIIAAITTNILALTVEEQERREAAREASEKLPSVRIARLVDLGTVDPDVQDNDPVTGDGNPALWRDVPPTGSPPEPGPATSGAPK